MPLSRYPMLTMQGWITIFIVKFIALRLKISDMEFPYTELESMLQDDSMNKCENSDHPDTFQLHMMDGDIPGFDMHEQDGLSYLAEGNDTEFLNFDDDDLTVMADDMPDAEDAQYIMKIAGGLLVQELFPSIYKLRSLKRQILEKVLFHWGNS